MTIAIRPLTAADAAEIRGWRYEPPYDVYNDDDLDDGRPDDDLADRHAFVDGDALIGFCSFGADARVPGGDYPDGPLDLGMGLRPDRTGAGLGTHLIAEALELAQRVYGATRVRATVWEPNQRALRLCERAGFRRVSRFLSRGRPFWILER